MHEFGGVCCALFYLQCIIHLVNLSIRGKGILVQLSTCDPHYFFFFFSPSFALDHAPSSTQVHWILLLPRSHALPLIPNRLLLIAVTIPRHWPPPTTRRRLGGTSRLLMKTRRLVPALPLATAASPEREHSMIWCGSTALVYTI